MTDKDAQYLAAVEAGDMETAQRMIDDAARDAGYGTYSHRRGDGKNVKATGWVVLFVDREKQNNLSYGPQEYLINELQLMEGIPDWMVDAYQEFIEWENAGLRNVEIMSREEAIENLAPPNIVAYAGAWDNPEWVSYLWENYENKLDGFVGVETPDGAAVWDAYSASIKSADPVTYDSNGNVIPLSRRFNQSSDSIYESAKSFLSLWN